MSTSDLEAAVREVLSRYSILAPHKTPEAHGPRGGFSGARIWRVETIRGGPVCVRAWPVASDFEAIAFRHRLMRHAHDSGLDFVPRLYAGPEGKTLLPHAGRFWEVQQWLPGQADFHARPTKARLEAACAALARLHAAWWRTDWTDEGACPGIARRANVVDEWRRALANGWRPLDWIDTDDPVRPPAERALHQLPSLIEQASGQLRAELGSRLLQPCLRDPWHDHFLFDGDRLVGLIDYGAVQIDATAVDLARALGSLVPDDGKAWETGLAAYRAVRAFSHADEALAHCLDRTGVTLSAASWLLRLFHHGEAVEDRAGVAARLEHLVERMEHWQGV